jgi:restriction system protein
MNTGQLFRFRHEMQKGDRVVTYDPGRRVYLLGTISGDYRWNPELDEDAKNARPVEWEGEISRDLLSVATKNSLGAISTLFLLPPEAAADLERALGTQQPVPQSGSEETDAGESDLFKDVQDRSIEFIKDHVSRLDWDAMQELVAGLLRAMGYKTQVSPSGPDRGKDIVASPDGFGFESPRIVVEVKHRGQAMGSQQIRSFLGGRHPEDKGLYVSTGGFTKDAYYEAERASIPITLMTLDDLVDALLEHYENLDIESKQLLPLKKIYWPA